MGNLDSRGFLKIPGLRCQFVLVFVLVRRPERLRTTQTLLASDGAIHLREIPELGNPRFWEWMPRGKQGGALR